MPSDVPRSCPICKLEHPEIKRARQPSTLTYHFSCPRCHEFITSHEFLLFGGGEAFNEQRHLISGLVRELNEKSDDEELPKVFTSTISTLLTHPLIPSDEDIDAKCEKILNYLKNKTPSLGTIVHLLAKTDMSVGYARDTKEFAALLQSLTNDGWIRIKISGNSSGSVFWRLELTDKGWKRVRSSVSSESIPQAVISSAVVPSLISIAIDDMSNETLRPNAEILALYDGLQLHPVVEKVSGRLFKDGHYAPAIFESYKAINNAVKQKAGAVDAPNDQALMAKVFSEESPILRINDLGDESEISEQIGFKFLFMGATTGIRNPKAHQNTEQKDPLRTLNYLAFASLLMTMVDESVVQQSPSLDKNG